MPSGAETLSLNAPSRRRRTSYDRGMPTRAAQNPRPILIDSRAPSEATTPTLFQKPVVPTWIPDTPVSGGIAGRILPRPGVALNLTA